MTLAAVSQTASGVPQRSTTRWRFEPGLPRSVGFGPTSSLAVPPFGRHRGAIDTRPRPVDLVRLTQPIQERQVQAVPHAGRLPVAEPPPTGHPTPPAQFGGQVLPGDARLEHEQDARQTRPIRNAGATTSRFGRLGRQQRLDDSP